MSHDNAELFIQEEGPSEWVCGGCDAYWFKEPSFSHCPFCHQDAIYPVYDDDRTDPYFDRNIPIYDNDTTSAD